MPSGSVCRLHRPKFLVLPLLSLALALLLPPCHPSGSRAAWLVQILALDLLVAAAAHCRRYRRRQALLAQTLVSKGEFGDQAVCHWPE